MKGDIKIPRPPHKGPVYSQSKLERKLMGPAAYYYYDVSDPYLTSGREMRDDGWEKVDLPHDFIIDQDNKKEFNNAHGYFEYFNGWYRKHFKFDEDVRGKRVLLQFGGIASQCTVYLNGSLLKRNYSAYNSFEVDITDNILYDEVNIIAIYVSTDEFEGWWYQGGGIYRNVNMVITEPVAIEQYGVYAPARKIDDENWAVDFETTVLNTSYEDAEVEVISSIIDKNGNAVAVSACKGNVALRDKATLKYTANVENPMLWDTEHPNLYRVKTVLKLGNEEIYEDNTRIGFRTVELDPNKGMFLNGKHIKIKGLCGHQDFGITGLAISDNIAKYKVKLFKEMGANGFRTAHYMHCEATMDALDEQGFIVMDETRWFETNEEAVTQLETLVKRDRNRPSVVFWSTSNEERNHITDMGQRVHKALYHIIKKLDKTRYILVAEDKEPINSTVYDDCDVLGVNYNVLNYDAVHEKWPDKPFLVSECAAAAHSRGGDLGVTYGRSTAWDVDINSWFLARENTWKAVSSREYVIGMYQWAAVEHRGEATWPAVCSRSGALDLFLQKKGGFYQNLSHFSDNPMAHILPHWNFEGLEGEEILVTVYTNCEELELLLNGKSLGKKVIEKYGRGTWNVPYEKGSLKVLGYIDGKLAAEDERKTTKKAVKLILTPMNEFTNNGEDIALFVCECLDEDGNIVPNASELVNFDVTGDAEYIGSGSDNCDHTTVTSHERKMYMGKITVAVKPKAGAKEFKLYASSKDCNITVKNYRF